LKLTSLIGISLARECHLFLASKTSAQTWWKCNNIIGTPGFCCLYDAFWCACRYWKTCCLSSRNKIPRLLSALVPIMHQHDAFLKWTAAHDHSCIYLTIFFVFCNLMIPAKNWKKMDRNCDKNQHLRLQ